MAPTASEANLIADIVAGINKKIKQEEDEDSDFDDEPELPSNRGNKLKRKAVYSQEGQLYGKRPYKKKVNHAGYDRYILNRKPKRYDLEGYPLDSDEEDPGADEDAADRDPYNGVDVLGQLKPLTAASELWRHPGMSQAYTNEMLPDMVQKSYDMLQREKSTLNLVKRLATKFRGDHTFIPCGDFYDESDKSMFDVEPMLRNIRAQVLGQGPERTPDAAIEVNVVSADAGAANGHGDDGTQAEDISMAHSDAVPATIEGAAEAITSAAEHPSANSAEHNAPNGDVDAGPPIQTIGVKEEPQPDLSGGNEASAQMNGTASGDSEDKEEKVEDVMDEDEPMPRMVTRGAAAAANGTNGSSIGNDTYKNRSVSPPASLAPVHPLFIPPSSTLPDRDLGLPPAEAEETRKLLNIFIQKQEEVVRGYERLYDSFLKANRLRSTVYRWSRAEGHVGEMSDGEEWVDQEEWGLDEPLRKGTADGEEETREEDRRGKGRRRGAA